MAQTLIDMRDRMTKLKVELMRQMNQLGQTVAMKKKLRNTISDLDTILNAVIPQRQALVDRMKKIESGEDAVGKQYTDWILGENWSRALSEGLNVVTGGGVEPEAPAPNILQFETMEEAQKALKDGKLKAGSKLRIGDDPYTHTVREP